MLDNARLNDACLRRARQGAVLKAHAEGLHACSLLASELSARKRSVPSMCKRFLCLSFEIDSRIVVFGVLGVSQLHLELL